MNFAKFWQIFDKNEITELCKGVHCVDLGESFQTHIYFQNLASIQPRTSPPKFARSLAVQPAPYSADLPLEHLPGIVDDFEEVRVRLPAAGPVLVVLHVGARNLDRGKCGDPFPCQTLDDRSRLYRRIVLFRQNCVFSRAQTRSLEKSEDARERRNMREREVNEGPGDALI